jgi:hypothetical protein
MGSFTNVPRRVCLLALFAFAGGALLACGPGDGSAEEEGADAPAPGEAVQPVDDAGTIELRLTLDKVERYVDATITLQEEGLGRALAGGDAMRSVLSEHGLTVEEYRTLATTIPAAFMVAEMRRAGAEAIPVPEGMDPAHLEFIESNLDEVGRELDRLGDVR